MELQWWLSPRCQVSFAPWVHWPFCPLEDFAGGCSGSGPTPFASTLPISLAFPCSWDALSTSRAQLLPTRFCSFCCPGQKSSSGPSPGHSLSIPSSGLSPGSLHLLDPFQGALAVSAPFTYTPSSHLQSLLPLGQIPSMYPRAWRRVRAQRQVLIRALKN